MACAAYWMASSKSAAVIPAGGGTDRVQVVGVDAVQAQERVEVDGSAGLEFGGLAVRDPDRGDETVFAVAEGDPDWRQAAATGREAR